MARLEGKSKLSKLSKLDKDSGDDKKNVTTSSRGTNITTGVMPKTIRFTPEELAVLDRITLSMQEETNKNINKSKVIRGLLWFAADNPSCLKKVLESLNKHI